jgi:hypothetical protein
MTHVPAHFDLPNYVAKLATTEDFKAASRTHGTTPEKLIMALAEEVKVVHQAELAQSLAEYERHVGGRALANLVDKLKAEKAAA